jgi:hypothetical protein
MRVVGQVKQEALLVLDGPSYGSNLVPGFDEHTPDDADVVAHELADLEHPGGRHSFIRFSDDPNLGLRYFFLLAWHVVS